LVEFLKSRSVDMLRLAGFDAESATALRRHWPQGPQAGFASEDRYVPLSTLRAEARGYLRSLSKNTREQIKRSSRLYEQQHGAAQLQPVTDLAGAQASFAELLALHLKRFAGRGQDSALANVRAQQFHQRLIAQCMAGDRTEAGGAVLKITFLRARFGAFTVGILYLLEYESRIYFYQSGFHYTDDRRAKPGLVTHALAIQHCLDAGFEEYDFLAGETNSMQYKVSLGSAVRTLVWWDLSRSNLKTHALNGLRSLRKRLRGG